jgi:hypothetical protein
MDILKTREWAVVMDKLRAYHAHLEARALDAVRKEEPASQALGQADGVLGVIRMFEEMKDGD